jgi:predicted RND superfamily exporter protein
MTLAFAAAAFTAHAQQQQSTVPPMHQPAAADASGFGNTNPNPRDPEQSRMMKEMTRDRNALRQKEIVEDTNHLMDLIKQLKDSVDKSSKDQLSLSVVNTATEIEKLAKSVKEKMRDGQ